MKKGRSEIFFGSLMFVMYRLKQQEKKAVLVLSCHGANGISPLNSSWNLGVQLFSQNTSQFMV